MSLLRPHQEQPVRDLVRILRAHPSAVDMSDTGTGKTFTACAVIKEMALPTLVVCPKIACSQWHRTAEHFGDSVDVINYEKLRTGRTPYGTWEREPTRETFLKCLNCQLVVDPDKPAPCYAHHAGIHCVSKIRAEQNLGRFTFHPAVKMVSFDEGHRCGALDSLNARMLIAARRQRIKTLLLSATLAASPLHMRAIGYALDLFPSPAAFPGWARRFGVRYDLAFHGYHWFATPEKQVEHMRLIGESLVPARGVRVTTDSIPGFPGVDVTSELYDLDEWEAVNGIYAQMHAALEKVSARAASDAGTQIVELLRAQQKVELLKVPIVIELLEKYLAAGFSMGVFCNFRQTLDELRARLKCDCFIDGSPDGVRHRQRSIDAFQSNASRLILVNSAAGREALSLHDLHGGHPRGGLVFPGHSAVGLKQVLGRFPRDGGKSRSFYKIILAARTGDVTIHRALQTKLGNLAALNDADLVPSRL